tara:strand:+ start:201 stop:398 length:198 start_codon:yes stop_codon:yes gene_type:complete
MRINKDDHRIVCYLNKIQRLLTHVSVLNKHRELTTWIEAVEKHTATLVEFHLRALIEEEQEINNQ